jgi:molybdopterin synthase sulfur carrier subunit
MAVTLRYWAAAKEAAGTPEEDFTGVATLSELLAQAVAQRPDDGRLARVLSRCAYLVDGDPVGLRRHDTVLVRPGAVVEALPPFAGG